MKKIKPSRLIRAVAMCGMLLFLNACNSYQKLPYFSNIKYAEESLSEPVIHEVKIKPHDILSIVVNSTIAGAAHDFNLPLVPSNSDKAVQSSVVSSLGSGSLQNYLVDKEGKINFPVLGSLKIAGMTTREIQDYITRLIYPDYIAKTPVVNVRLLNFKVAVLGEVNRPGMYEALNGQMTLLDALAAAGDMTIYGKRDNVLLTRTKETGEIVSYRINLQDKLLIANEDIFYLQQNDRLYVETNKAKGNNSAFGTVQSISLTAVSIVISMIALLTRLK